MNSKLCIHVFVVFLSLCFLVSPILSATPAHAQTINDGDTVRVTGSIDVYIVKIVGAKKFKRLVLNPQIFNSYGQLSWSAIKDVDQATMNEFTDSNLVQHVNAQGVVVDPKIYAITSSANNYDPNKTGTKRWLNITGAQFSAAGLDWDSVYKINDLEAADTFYPTAIALTASDDLGTWATNVNGDSGSSTTISSSPAVTTSEATSLGSYSATLNGFVNPSGASTTAWFRYSVVNPGTCNDTFGARTPSSGGTVINPGNIAIAFSQMITSGLTAVTTYYFCAIAQNSAGTSFGTVETFATSQGLPPTLSTSAATTITSSSAILNSYVDPNGSASSTWFRYWLSADKPSSCIDSGFTSKRVPSSGGVSVANGGGVNSETISGLSANTTYYFCAIAQNSKGTSLGSMMSFTTAYAVTEVQARIICTVAYGTSQAKDWDYDVIIAIGGEPIVENNISYPDVTQVLHSYSDASSPPAGANETIYRWAACPSFLPLPS